MYILFFFVTKFFQYYDLYKIFLFYTFGTLLYIAEPHVSKYLRCLVILQLINSNPSDSLISYLHHKFSGCLLTTLLPAF